MSHALVRADEPDHDVRANLRRGTLGRQLVVRVGALTAAVAILLSALSLGVVYAVMLQERGQEVAQLAQRAMGSARDIRRPREESIIIVQANGVARVQYVNAEGSQAELSGDGLNALFNLPRDNQYHLLQVPGAGFFYVYSGTRAPGPDAARPPGGQPTQPQQSQPGSDLQAVIVGITIADINSMALAILGVELLLTALAIGIAVLVIGRIVTSSLRPLNQLAATAREVAAMPLDRGEVDLTARAPTDPTKPENEVNRVGQSFNVMLDHVGDALAARQASETKVRQFVADASHELRNPLAAIRGYAELTRRSRDQLPPDTARAMERIEAESTRMSSLVEDMLLLARLDNNPQLDLVDVDLTELVINAVLDARVAGPDHRWELDLPDEPVVARADRHRIYQVIVNLLTNARVHTPAGTSVRAGLAIRGSEAVITVHDDGPGIPADMQAKVFERFTRADKSRVRMQPSTGAGSTGLGLAIVQGVIEAHHGHVDVESRPGSTTFTVRLPRA